MMAKVYIKILMVNKAKRLSLNSLTQNNSGWKNSRSKQNTFMCLLIKNSIKYQDILEVILPESVNFSRCTTAEQHL